jgi:prepilin-type processing-associated H-X9-DG protein
MREEKLKFEEGILAELIFRTSDVSQLAKWPLRLLAIVCASGSIVIWYEKYEWYQYLNDKDIAFLGSFLHFIEIMSVALKAGLFISSIVVLISLAFFIFLFFNRHTSKAMSEAIQVLLSNSFCFGISLAFILLTTSNIHREASQVILVATQKINCSNNLKKLGQALLFYAKNNRHHYPPPDRWCDLLIEYTEVTESDFLCPGPAQGRCHYAINPSAEPISRYDDFDHFLESYGVDYKEIMKHLDSKEGKKAFEFLHDRYFAYHLDKMDELSNLVLLFETKKGWNQFGGLELLTTENHKGEGANILFNDGSVKFLEPDRFGKLKWKVEEDESD